MSYVRNTRDLVKPASREWRRQFKLRLLEELRRMNRPQTIGDLFLLTGKNHTTLSVLLAELREEGLVQSELRNLYMKTYSGQEIRRQALHYSLVPPRKIHR